MIRTERTTATRDRGRMRYDTAAAHAILDEAYDCTVAFVVDGEPRALPTLHARVGDTLYLHGSSGGRMGLTARDGGIPVCVTVTLLDGLVYARSQFHHSANYRSVVVHGVAAAVVDEDEKRAAMTALVERLGAGRAAESRPADRRELAQTSVLAIPLDEVSVRVRSGGVADDPDDLALPHWAGVLPIRRVTGPPEPDQGVRVAAPRCLPGPRPAWNDPVPLRGERVHLEPLSPAHVDELFTSLDDEQVWRFLHVPRPAGRDELAALVDTALRDQWAGTRAAWAQIDPHTGTAIGMTCYHDVDPAAGSVGIGHTILGRPWWRSGVNREAKLLLLERAFDVLGAQRVFWYTDVRNERSQRAIAGLGASRDGVIRRHRLRPDGTWRDSVLFALTADEWPAAAEHLRAGLAAAGARARPAAAADARTRPAAADASARHGVS